MTKSRKFSESYLKMAFTSVLDNGDEKPPCVLVFSVLSNEAIKPSKFKRHQQQKHQEHVEKNLDYFKDKNSC